MELIKHTRLLYQAGSSDKVYEVDLCDTGESLYVVNFRYGRRGSTLREGKKTIQPVSLAEAEKIFDKLVSSKIKTGYQDVTNLTPTDVPDEDPSYPLSDESRQQAILNHLAGKGNNKWPLERAIWRAGELKIGEAAPLLIKLIGTGEPLRDYCIAWALGWCGDRSAIPHLIGLYDNPSTPDFVKRIAFEARIKLADENVQKDLRFEQIKHLPQELWELTRSGTTEEFSTALRTYLDQGNYQNFTVLDTIYQIDKENTRPALLNILRTAPLQPKYFKPIRHIFKMAEYRHDTEVFAILAYRFEKEKAMYSNRGWGVSLPNGKYIQKHQYQYDKQSRRYEIVASPIQEELKSPNARIAYNSMTRNYLRRRVWRTLKQLGEEGESEYINMAVAILLHYSDADASSPKQSSFYRWDYTSRRSIRYTNNWDIYASYLVFNHILYENSPRYFFVTTSQAWRCREDYKPGDPEPDVREEAFPKLWENYPNSLLRLLLESNCHPVHLFAVKALRVCEDFCSEIGTNILIKLLNKAYEITAQFGFEIAQGRYNPDNPNLELVLALAKCSFEPARIQAHEWIELRRDRFLDSANFIVALVTCEYSDTRSFIRKLVSSYPLSNTTAKVFIGKLIAKLLTFETNQAELAKEITSILLSFSIHLRELSFEVIQDLLAHPMPEIQALGANILLNHETPVANLPPELILSLIKSPHDSVRVIGVRIFGELPDKRLLQNYDLLLATISHEVEDMRNAMRPVIQRLANSYTECFTRLVVDFINLLLKKEKHEGVHSYLVLLLQEDFPGWMSNTGKETALKLLHAKSSAAQELGGLVLQDNYQNWVGEFETKEIVKLASHEILSVRQAAWTMFEQILERIRTNEQEKLAAVRILEAKWDDSRKFAWEFFNNQFTSEDWTPKVMISICDSIRDDVRQFGRDLVTSHFQENNGQEYLLKFSEHPSADMQLFATNYLEHYAVDNSERLRELTPYFISVLSTVNRGRIAKQRVFTFLEAEAQKSEAAAQVVAEIITKQSMTIAIGDKATAIQTMLKIRQQYPQISLPIKIKEVSEVRN
ncbi:MAG: WGR domain-containing protein [Moorea sp. SIO2B7]|nr:WGR domain-containing protein [Moorena sp. SIO2B7]